LSGEISEVQIAQTLVVLRAFAEIMGLPSPALEAMLDRAQKDLQDVPRRERPPGPPE